MEKLLSDPRIDNPKSAPTQTAASRPTQRTNTTPGATARQTASLSIPPAQNQGKQTSFPWWWFVIGFIILVAIVGGN